ncbi:MAG TPA: shikimate dehydrogenase [Bacteroidales bacterium]|nr:shikimate dehydrogenase [Bacteroidales bacterium]
MRLFGLIGYPLTHSFSEKYFTEKFKREKISDARYMLFPMKEISDFASLIKRYNFSGMNVTIPFKTSVMGLLDEIDEEAAAVGAVNTIKFIKSSDKLISKGYNTDIFGFEKLADKFVLPPNTRALILGTGGGSKAVAYVLKKRNIPYSLVSRNPVDPAYSYQSLTKEIISGHQLIINTTPLGMFPEVDTFPDIPYSCISPGHVCIDLVYNPEMTAFLMKCGHRKAAVVNGMEMLYAQAERSWEIWNK